MSPRLRSLTLRTKVLALVLGLLGLVSAAVAVATDLGLQQFLLGRLDDQLVQADGRTNDAFGGGRAGGIGGPDGPGGPGQEPTLEDLLRGQNAGTLVARVRDGVTTARVGGRALGSSSSVPASDVVVLGALAADRRPHGLRVDGHDYRVLARKMGDGDVVITGLPTAGVDATLRRLTVVELGVTALGLVVAALAALGLLRLTLRPLRRVAATARRVAELPLDRGEVALAERVPEIDTDPRTEIGQVGAALNTMLGHVAGALQARHVSESKLRQFVADASHELRTPLASIRGYAELSRRSPDPIPADVAHALGRVESEAIRMTSLVEDLLLLARLDAGRPLEVDVVDLSRLLVDAVGDAHAAGPQHIWRLDLPDEPVLVRGDDARLHQVVSNLLSNARTHTPPGTTVTARVTARPDGVAVIGVLDNGPGVPATVLPTVFERFARADTSRSRTAGGTGLGLAIVAAVVHAHGGTVDVTSAPGQTAFLVRLPLAPLPATRERVHG